MSWVSLDDKFHRNPKVTNVGLSGAGLYARALSYCGDCLTDGYVPFGWSREVGNAALCKKLAAVGLWLEVKKGSVFTYEIDGEPYQVVISGNGYLIPDYLLFNPTKAYVEQKRDEVRKKRSDAGKKGAAARWGVGKQDGKSDGKPHGSSNGKAHGKPIATPWQTDGPTPLPLEEQNPVTDTALKDPAREPDQPGFGDGEIELAEINRRLAEAAAEDAA